MKRVLATFRIALRALRRNKMRTLLTMLGMIIGVAAVISAIGIGNGAKSQVEAQIASLGQNVVSVFPGSFTAGGARGGWGSFSTLVPEEAKAIAQEIYGVEAVSCEVRDRQQVMANGLNWNTQVLGESPDYLGIRAWGLDTGAMFTESDVNGAAKVAVIGKTIVDQLYSGANPIGETIRIRNMPFKVVGVLRAKGVNFFGQDQDDVVIIPYTSAMRRVSRKQYLSAILIQASEPGQMPRIQQETTDLLQQRRPGRDPDFTVRNQLELAQAATATSKTMTMLVGAIASISLVVGGIGIMNIMLVSVTERTREIGIRMAVGARGRDILLQFLTEAVTLSVLGGTMGIILGFIIAHFISAKTSWPTVISPTSVVIAFVFSAAVGIFFGFYPARKASRLDPIDALRYE
ncbi:MAG TPA: ABC transporter permease [Candidatus Paceibacterota bacterium]|nr:ABC transporter permease [Candidatus Paceibacterota bacterium]